MSGLDGEAAPPTGHAASPQASFSEPLAELPQAAAFRGRDPGEAAQLRTKHVLHRPSRPRPPAAGFQQHRRQPASRLRQLPRRADAPMCGVPSRIGTLLELPWRPLGTQRPGAAAKWHLRGLHALNRHPTWYRRRGVRPENRIPRTAPMNHRHQDRHSQMAKPARSRPHKGLKQSLRSPTAPCHTSQSSVPSWFPDIRRVFESPGRVARASRCSDDLRENDLQ